MAATARPERDASDRDRGRICVRDAAMLSGIALSQMARRRGRPAVVSALAVTCRTIGTGVAAHPKAIAAPLCALRRGGALEPAGQRAGDALRLSPAPPCRAAQPSPAP